jgi:hypothetical protein
MINWKYLCADNNESLEIMVNKYIKQGYVLVPESSQLAFVSHRINMSTDRMHERHSVWMYKDTYEELVSLDDLP